MVSSEDYDVIPLDGMKGVAYLLDHDGRIVDCNKGMENVLGIDRSDLLLRRFVDFDRNSGIVIDRLHDTMLGIVEDAHVSPIVRLGCCYVQTIDLLMHMDSQLMMSMEKRVIKDHKGNNLGLLSVGFDVELENDKSDLVELSVFKNLLENHRKLLETNLYKINAISALIGDNSGDEKAKIKSFMNQFSMDLSLSCSQLGQILKTKFIMKYENKSKVFYYRLLYVSDQGGFSKFYDSLIRNECFNPYVCSVEEFEEDLVLRSQLVSGLFDLLIVEVRNNQIPCWAWKVSERCIMVVLGDADDNAKHGVLAEDVFFLSNESIKEEIEDKEKVEDLVDQFFCLWNKFRVDSICRRVLKQGRFNVLIVEDYAESRESLASLIEALFGTYDLVDIRINIVKAINGSEALNWAVNIEFDLMVLDLGLPDLTGFDVAIKIRNLEQQKGTDCYSYIVVNTGHCFDIIMSHERLQKYGFDEAHLKPALAGQVDRILRQFVSEDGQVQSLVEVE